MAFTTPLSVLRNSQVSRDQRGVGLWSPRATQARLYSEQRFSVGMGLLGDTEDVSGERGKWRSVANGASSGNFFGALISEENKARLGKTASIMAISSLRICDISLGNSAFDLFTLSASESAFSVAGSSRARSMTGSVKACLGSLSRGGSQNPIRPSVQTARMAAKTTSGLPRRVDRFSLNRHY